MNQVSNPKQTSVNKLRALFSVHKMAFIFFGFYVLTSILLSFSVFLRLQIASPDIREFNFVIYFCNYFATPLAATIWLLFYPSSLPPEKIRLKQFTFSISIIYLILLYLAMILPLPEYIFSWMPIFLMSFFSNILGKTKNRLFNKAIVLVIIMLCLLMPNIFAFVSYKEFLTDASTIIDQTDRVTFVSSYVNNITAFGYPFRAYDDWWEFLLSGAGHCGEMATATITFLDNLNIEARKVDLPGENHEFVEVKINGNWYVTDPGYYPSEILTREERAVRRIYDVGAISYVIAYVSTSFVELTQYYVPTDTIVIRVTYSNEPLVNAQVYLSHKFMGGEWRLPDSSSSFYTDGNGTITLHMGALTYNHKAEPYEPYYWIYVNGKNTGYIVNSTGTGKTHLIGIDLTS